MAAGASARRLRPILRGSPRTGEHLRMTVIACADWPKKILRFLIPGLQGGFIIAASCSTKGRFLEAILRRTERAPAGAGAPASADEAGGRRWSAGRRSALRHWARGVT